MHKMHCLPSWFFSHTWTQRTEQSRSKTKLTQRQRQRTNIRLKGGGGLLFLFSSPFLWQNPKSNKTELAPYPFSCPVGPMDVANMRLKSIGSLRSLLVTGDFMLYFLNVSPISYLLMPSIWTHIKQQSQQRRNNLNFQTQCINTKVMIQTSGHNAKT